MRRCRLLAQSLAAVSGPWDGMERPVASQRKLRRGFLLVASPIHPSLKKNRSFSDAHHSRIADAVLYVSIDSRIETLCRTYLLTGPAGSPSQVVSESGSGPKATTSLFEATITGLSAKARLAPKPSSGSAKSNHRRRKLNNGSHEYESMCRV